MPAAGFYIDDTENEVEKTVCENLERVATMAFCVLSAERLRLAVRKD